MPATIEQLAMEKAANVAEGISNAGMGMALAGWADRRQRKQQEQLNNLQIEANKKMMAIQNAGQLQMWKDTSYPAQMEMMKKAGLNPGLMYGMGGGGGQSMGAGAPNVGGANAPVGGGEAQAAMGMGIQMRLLEAQRANIEANTEKTKIEAGKIQGADTMEANSRTSLNQIHQDIAAIDLEIKQKTVPEAINTIQITMQKASEDFDRMVRENAIGQATYEAQIEQAQANLIKTGLENALIKTQTRLGEYQIKKIIADVQQAWAHIDIDKQQLIINRINQGTNQQNAQTQEMDATTRRQALNFEKTIKNITEHDKQIVDIVERILQAVTLRGALK